MISLTKVRWNENFQGLRDMARHSVRTAGTVGETAYLSLAFLARSLFPQRSPHAKTQPASIIVVGGEFRNKGSQAMTLVVLDQVRQRCPDAIIHLFSPFETDLGEETQRALGLTSVSWTWETKRRLLRPCGIRTRDARLQVAIDALRRATAIVDISGYAFSSQWGGMKSFEYLASLMIARRFAVPYIIMPQSIGPLDYHGIDRWIVPRWLIRRCLRGAARIYGREDSAVKAVMAFSPQNIVGARDIVLMNPAQDLSCIATHPPARLTIAIEPKTIGVFPNVKVMKHIPASGMREGYVAIIRALRAAGRPVVLVSHAVQDLPVCRELKSRFGTDPGVRLIDEDLSAPQLIGVIRQCDFVVASRYHAVIHAFKQAVPALVLGWADKYQELLTEFGQESYAFDVRAGVSEDKVLAALQRLMDNHLREQQQIRSVLGQLTGENPFDHLGLSPTRPISPGRCA